MQASILGLVSMIAAPVLAMSDVVPEQALVSKFNNSGFTTTAGVRQERCSLFAERIVISRRYGVNPGVEVVEERRVQLSGELPQILVAAKEEALITQANLMCDGPSTEVSMQQTPEHGERTVLFATGGCGSPSLRRGGPATRMLRDLIDSFCPRTYEAPRPMDPSALEP